MQWMPIALPVAVTLTLFVQVQGCDQAAPRVSEAAPAYSTAVDSASIQTERAVVFAAYNYAHGLRNSEFPRKTAIIIVRDGGDVIWSDDPINGGRPYFRGEIPRSEIPGAIESICSAMQLSESRQHFGPDSEVTVLSARCGGEFLSLISWHDLFEQDPRLVVSSHGIEVLGGRTRDAVRRSDSADYVAFLNSWGEVRRILASLIPDRGELTDDPSRDIEHLDPWK